VSVHVITGAASGIGRATAELLIADGYAVVGVDRDEGALADTRAALGAGFHPVVGDVGEWETHERAADAAGKLGRLLGWVNNAGIDVQDPAHRTNPATIDRGLRVLQLGVMYGSAVAVRRMLSSGGGSIVNVSSVQGLRAFPGYYTYQAAKGAVIAISRGVAVDYGARGIRCNAVCPGAVLTRLGMTGAQGEELERKQQAAREDGARLAPLARIGEPSEIGEVIRFLLSERASFVTGATIVVDGGATARCFPYPPPEVETRDQM
jgi:NAD(P)-dependent dehydrogenase (short-subunit alcohol dehydrogenase family)